MWIIYALLTAILLATSDALTKRVLASRDEYFVAWARLLFSLPVFLACLLFIEIPPLNKNFWLATVIAMPFEIIAMILYTKALKVSPISLTAPFLSLTPLLLILMSYFILGEKVSLTGGIGVLFIASGSYTLHIHKVRHSLLEPVKAVFREKGSVLMIIVAFIFSITSSLGKMAITNSSPVFFGSFYFILLTILFTPIALSKSRDRIAITGKDILPLAAIGITYALMIVFHMTAMGLTKVAYMISVKRMSLLFSILYGHLLFKEEKIAERAIGGVMMFIGFLLIVLSR
ncbi:MAG: EamA family transporter [Nitrospirae bacterium]|nr:EamA family transporter [Nitrospirota bacterium]